MFADVVDVGVFVQDVFLGGEIADACRDGDDFHVRKFMEAVAQGVDIEVLRNVDSFFLHGLEDVVQLGIDVLVHGTANFGRGRGVAEIALEGQEPVFYHVVKRRPAEGVWRRQNLCVRNHAAAEVFVVSFFLFDTEHV